MGEFSVNTDKIKSIADLLEQQADVLENAGDSIDVIRQNLQLESSAKVAVMSAMKTTSSRARDDSRSAAQMGRALREIAAVYRTTENSILGRLSSGGGNGAGGNGSAGGNGAGGDGSQNGKNNNSGAYSKDPVNLNTGNFILDNHDMEIPGFQPFVLGRFYNSMGTFTGMLGKDWNTSFELKLETSEEHYLHGANIKVVLEDGREEYFASADGKKFIQISGTTAELELSEDGYIYKTLEGDRYLFDKSGKYVRFENSHQLGFQLIYNGNELERVEKDTGEYFALSYKDGLLSTVEDHTGRCCRYIFKEGKLQQVVLPDGNSYQYFYNSNGKISRVFNPRMVDAVETEYDDRFRVTYQKFADGTTNTFEYQDAAQAVVMIERNGSKSIHYHNEKYQNIRNVYPDGEESFEYNERGQKISVKDKCGNVTRIQYDNKGNIAHILYPDKTKVAATYNQQNLLLTMSVNGSIKVKNQYNALGDLINSEDGLGRKTSYTYDKYGRPLEICMPDGSVTSAAYDDRGNLSNARTANGGIHHYKYDALNQLVEYTNAMDQKNAYTYDVMGRVLSETRADGNSKYYQYDEWGNVVSIKDFDGNVSAAEYNENNKMKVLTDAAGRKTYFEYDAMWNVSKAILPNGGVFRYLYNENNYLETSCDAEGNETHYTYDALGNMLSKVDAEGAETNYVWDSHGRCIKIIAADGTTTEYGYDEEDRIIYAKDAEDIELFRIFDEAGQLVGEKDSLGRERTYSYNEVGDVIEVIDEMGHRTEYEYAKGLHKVAAVLYPNGTKETYLYDLNGNIKEHTDIYGVTKRYEYDELNRVVASFQGADKLLEYEYDLLGRVISEKDFTGSFVRYEYSPTGQLLAVVDALGNTTNYSYDAIDELVEVLRKTQNMEQQVRITYERNLMGQLTKVTDALGHTERYQYNGLGKITEKIDRDDYSTKYAYNCLGLLSAIKWADGKETSYEYSPMRRLQKVSDWTGVTQFNYDGQGKLVQITYPDERILSIGYNAHGNKEQMTYPNGQQVSYEYDSMDRLKKVIQGSAVVTYAYNSMGDVTSRSLSNGSDIQYQYNEQGLLSRMTHVDSEGVLDDWSFGYDLAGRRTQQDIYRRDYSKDNGAYKYTYDAVGRLQKVMKDDQLIREYEYDQLGNRSGMKSLNPQTSLFERTDYEYDLRGGLLKLTAPGLTEEYKYDKRGNLTTLMRNGQTNQKYNYDAFGRLAHAQNANGDQASYQYNGLGYRIGMHTMRNGQENTVSYVVDYNKLYDNLLEKKENGQTETYLWGAGLEGYMTKDKTEGWYVTDSQGSVMRSMNGTDTVYAENYDEFGNSMLGYNGADEIFGYNGFLLDPVAGNYFAQARQYRNYTGTFDAMDRFGGDITMPGTMHPYSYCMHDPFSYTDKTAYWAGIDDLIAAGVGLVVGLGGQFVGDMITSAATGDFQLSSWQEYVGSGIGGAAGGVAALYTGPIGAGAVSSGVSSLTTEGLTWASDPDGYTKSFGEAARDVAIDTGLGALMGGLSQLGGKIVQKIAGSKLGKTIASKLAGGGKLGSFISKQIEKAASGVPGRWEQLMRLIKSQSNAGFPNLLSKLLGYLGKQLPLYVIISSIKDGTEGKRKNMIKDWLYDLLGWNDSDTECAAAA